MKALHFNIGDVSNYRTHLMGIATIMIIACHAPGSGVLMPGILSKTLVLGNYGVDIFLLLSGLGLYFSLSKNPIGWGGDLIYCKRRFSRLFVPYSIIYLPYCVILMFLGIYSIVDSLLSLTALEYWLFHRGAWFVSFIAILYLLAPLLYKLLTGSYRWIWALTLIIVVVMICSIPVDDHSATSVIYNIQWAFSRTPCFIIGMVCGKECKELKSIPVLWLALMAVLGIISIKIFSRGDFLMIPFFIWLCVVFLQATKEVKWIDKCLFFVGTISLESYLTNITLNNILMKIIPSRISSPLFYGRYLEYIIVIVVGLIIAYLVNKFVSHKRTNLIEK